MMDANVQMNLKVVIIFAYSQDPRVVQFNASVPPFRLLNAHYVNTSKGPC